MEIRQIRSSPEDEAWIKEALILSARLHLVMWNSSMSASLAKEATALGAKSTADDLLASLKRASAAGEKWTAATHPWADATPLDAGWYRNSTLFDTNAWDQVELEKTKALQPGPARMALVIICLFLCVPSMGTVLMGFKSPVDKPDMTKTYS